MRNYISGECIFGDATYIPEEYMSERWWFIDGHPGYMISDKMRVWSEKSQQFMTIKKLDKHGHLGVCLTHNGHRYYEYIHRLMAKAFIPNPNHYPIVRHLNDNPSDNNIENLQWGTYKDNSRDCMNNGHAHFVTPDERETWLQKIRRPIRAINLETNEETLFRGQNEASRVLGIHQANIWKVLKGERSHTCGYYFEYLSGGESVGD